MRTHARWHHNPAVGKTSPRWAPRRTVGDGCPHPACCGSCLLFRLDGGAVRIQPRTRRRFPEVYLGQDGTATGICGLGSDSIATCKRLCNAIGPRCIGFDVSDDYALCRAVGMDLVKTDEAIAEATGKAGLLSALKKGRPCPHGWGFKSGQGKGAISDTICELPFTNLNSRTTCYRKEGGALGTHLQTKRSAPRGRRATASLHNTMPCLTHRHFFACIAACTSPSIARLLLLRSANQAGHRDDHGSGEHHACR